jgi:hypothetical protein
MNELQGWLVVAAAWVAACGTCFRAYVAWRAHQLTDPWQGQRAIRMLMNTIRHLRDERG